MILMVTWIKSYANFDCLASQIKHFPKKINLTFCVLGLPNSHRHGTDCNIIGPNFEGKNYTTWTVIHSFLVLKQKKQSKTCWVN